MDYAIILRFDETTESVFNSIIKSIADSEASSYLIDVKIPPHITLALFCTDNVESITNELDKHIESFNAGDITWVSLGAFVPYALFAAPVLNEYLLSACINANNLINPFSIPGDNGRYLPYQWVPHTSLAVQLDNETLKKAFNTASKQFVATKGQANRLILVECNPYTEIKAWDIT